MLSVIGQRKDGVLLVSLADGYIAVNLTTGRIAPIEHRRTVADFETWPELPIAQRRAFEPKIQKLLDSRPRKVHLRDVGYEAESASMDERRRCIEAALNETVKRRFGSVAGYGQPVSPMSWWIKDIKDLDDPPYIIYSDAEGKHFKWEYSDKNGCEFLGDPVPVEYVPIEK